MEAADARALRTLGAIWAAHRDVSPEGQLRIVLEALDPALPGALGPAAWEAAATAYATPALVHSPTVSPGAGEAVRALRARGFRLGVISNTGRTPGRVLRQLLARAGLLDAFEVLSFSDEVGARKPAAAIFTRTLAAVGCAAPEALHVGDDAEADVAGARGVGMRALHYAPAGTPAASRADGVVRDLGELPALVARLG